MTRTEIEKQALSLSAQDRAALAQALRASLPEGDTLSTAEKVELEQLRTTLMPQLEALFQGETVELNDEFWQRLLSAEPTEEELDRPLGLGVPPEWSGRTLRELRATAKQE
jgi:hypothetical protein